MSASGSALTVKATLTADGSGLSGAAQKGVSDLNSLKTAAGGVTTAGKQMGDQISQGAASFKTLQQGIDVATNLGKTVKSARDSYAAFEATLAGKSAIDAASTATKDLTKNFQLNAFQVNELTYAGRHLFEQIAAGINPMQIAATETLHLSAAFNTTEERAGLLSLATKAILSPLGLTIIGFTVLTGALALVAYEGYEYEKSVKAIGDAINLNLPQIALTEKQYVALSQSVAQAGDVSQSTARDMAKSMAGAGIVPSAWTDLAAAARDYAAATGKAVPDALNDLDEKLKKPSAGLEDLNRIYGIITQASLDYVRSLEAEGRTDEARTAAVAALRQGMHQLALGAGDTGSAFDTAAHALSTFYDNLVELSKEAQQQGATKFDIDFNIATQAATQAPDKTGDATRAANIQRQQAVDLYNKLVPLQSRVNELQGEYEQIEWAVIRGDLTQAQGKQALVNITRDLADAVKGLNAGSLASNVDKFYDQFGGYTKKTTDLGNAHWQLRQAIASGTLDAKHLQEAQTALAGVEFENAVAAKAHADELKRLSGVTDDWKGRIKGAIESGQEAIAQAKLQATSEEALATALLHSSLAYQQVQDKEAQERAALPYLTLALHAQGVQRQQLLAIAQQMAKSTADQQTAKNFIDAVNQIRGAMQSLTEFAPRSAQLTALDEAKEKLDDWRKQMLADLDAWRTQSTLSIDETTQEYNAFAGDLQTVYQDKLANLYRQDLANRKDWAAGVQRANDDITKSQQDMASKSAAAMKEWDSDAEQDFVSLATTGKLQTSSLVTFVLQEIAKLAYEKYFQQGMDSLGNLFLSAIGDAFGVSGAGATAGASAASSFEGQWSVGVGHTGMTVGYGAPSYRSVDPGLFIGAPRHHSGKGPNLMPDERAVIVRQGETIRTEQQEDAMQYAAHAPIQIDLGKWSAAQQQQALIVNVNVKHADGVSVKSGQPKSNGSGGYDLDIIVDLVDNGIAAKINKGRAATGQAFENRYQMVRKGIVR